MSMPLKSHAGPEQFVGRGEGDWPPVRASKFVPWTGLADYRKTRSDVPGAMEQLGTSQRTVETLTRELPSADTGSPTPRRSWWPFGRR